MTRVFMLVLLGVLVGVVCSYADTTFVAGGHVGGEWTEQHSPYMVQGEIDIPTQHRLIIGQGAEVVFTGYYGLTVTGSLVVHGVEGDSVIFRPATESTIWRGLDLTSLDTTSVLEYCVVEDVRDLYHAGIRLSAASAYLSHCTVRSTQKQGIMAMGGAVLTVEHSTIFGCGGDGSGIVGGGLFFSGATEATISDCRILNNWASGGGAIFSQSPVVLTIEDSKISGNHSTVDGGGLDIDGGFLTLRNCTIEGNRAHVWGGGAFIWSGGQAQIEGCTFCADTSELGSGVYIATQVTLSVITRTLFAHNVAGYAGVQGYGTIYISGSDYTLTLDRCTLVDNENVENSQPIIYGPLQRITNCILAFNRVGPVLSEGRAAGPLVDFCTFYGNEQGDWLNSTQRGFGQITTVNANGDSCDGYRNLFFDPQFQDMAGGDFHLMANSPCIDAGDPTATLDPDSTVADMGAFYFPQNLAGDPSRKASLPLSPAMLCYPNPFNPATTISFTLKQAAEVTLTVFDIQGRTLATLAHEPMPAGTYRRVWNAVAEPSGMYFIRLNAGSTRLTQKLVVLK